MLVAEGLYEESHGDPWCSIGGGVDAGLDRLFGRRRFGRLAELAARRGGEPDDHVSGAEVDRAARGRAGRPEPVRQEEEQQESLSPFPVRPFRPAGRHSLCLFPEPALFALGGDISAEKPPFSGD